MSLAINDKTQEVIEVLSDDEAIRMWTREVRDPNDVEDLPDKTREWVDGIDWLDDLEAEEVQWGHVVDFLLGNLT